MTEDKPCPFCGCKEIAECTTASRGILKTTYAMQCIECHASGPPIYKGEEDDPMDKANECWNMRSD